MADGESTSHITTLIQTSPGLSKFQVVRCKADHERGCAEVGTVSPSHHRLMATTTKSACCALHEITIVNAL